jgi:hypothetical protein
MLPTITTDDIGLQKCSKCGTEQVKKTKLILI